MARSRISFKGPSSEMRIDSARGAYIKERKILRILKEAGTARTTA
jgi:hypothetical protein